MRQSLNAASIAFASLVGACSNGGVSATTGAEAGCPQLPSGVVSPTPVETSQRRIELGEVSWAPLIDADGVYWFTPSGALLAMPHGTGLVTELRPAPPEGMTLLETLSDESHVYWAEAAASTTDGLSLGFSLPPAPGKVFKVPKAGGAATLLAQENETLLHLKGFVDSLLVLSRSDYETGLFAVSKDGGALESTALLVPAESSRVIGDKVYWYENTADSSDVNGYFQDLFRSNLDGSELAQLGPIQGWGFIKTGNRLLWTQEQTIVEPLLLLQENFMMRNEDTGCTQELPSVGESISFNFLLDEQHAYWLSFNKLGALRMPTLGPDGTIDPTIMSDPLSTLEADPNAKPLIRVDVETGRLERLHTTGFLAGLGNQIVGQTDAEVFISDGQGLVAVAKPPPLAP